MSKVLKLTSYHSSVIQSLVGASRWFSTYDISNAFLSTDASSIKREKAQDLSYIDSTY